MAKKRDRLIRWFSKKFQLFLYHGKSYDVIWKIRFNRIGFISVLLLSIALFFCISYVIIAYTSLKETLPDFPTEETKILIYENAIRTDSLIAEIDKRDLYMKMIHDLIFDEIPIDQDYVVPTQHLTEQQIKDFNNPLANRKETNKIIHSTTEPQIEETVDSSENTKKIDEDIQPQVEQPVKELEKVLRDKDSSESTDKNIQYSISSKEIMPALFPPLRGYIVSSFDKHKNHYGTDIASSGETTIYSVLGGTVLASDYTLKNGYTIIIQHKYDLVSVYKHNKSVLVSVGQYVEVGHPIAVYGNTGEYTSGEHLHFELWKKGVPLNPEDYIDFK
ncbi:MAG: M23 family metallopeptidase [Bacteroidales bacterium]|jgi:murein DD-endopeptidase MepM/ murein hydrolase activator NlpD|nr:M23 family metallopeptidase [Bacteroidales bacterium]